MVAENEKTEFLRRVAALNKNAKAISRVTLTAPNGEVLVDLNHPTKQENSRVVVAHVADNLGRVTPDAARAALNLYGSAYIAEHNSKDPNVRVEHPAIGALERIASSGITAHAKIDREYFAMPFPLPPARLQQIVQEFGTPVIAYNESMILDRVHQFNLAMKGIGEGTFMNMAALKATVVADVQSTLYANGMGADCSSPNELFIAKACGLPSDKIILTANGVDASEYRLARDLGVTINFDDITDILMYQNEVGPLPETVMIRYNPGPRKSEGVNGIIGKPEEQKFGIPHEFIADAVRLLQKGGVKNIGLHMMVASNELDVRNHIGTSELAFKAVEHIKRETGADVKKVNFGGGWGIPYKPEQRDLDIDELGNGYRFNYDELITKKGLHPLELMTENGRWVAGPAGILLSRVLRVQKKYFDLVRLDTTIVNNMRPGVYDAYHHIEILGKETDPRTNVYSLGGSLCENCDYQARGRSLPLIVAGDLAGIFGVGAHAPEMAYRYNSRMPAARVNAKVDGTNVMVIRAENELDLMRTHDIPHNAAFMDRYRALAEPWLRSKGIKIS